MITEREQREARIALRLWKMGNGDVLRGVTSGDQVKQRMRAAIIGKRIGAETVGFTKEGVHINFAQAFESTYGEPLQQEISA